MSTIKPPPTNRIVCVTAIDRTAASEPVLTSAATLAQSMLMSNAELHVLYVIPLEALPENVMTSVSQLMEEARVFMDAKTREAAKSFAGRVYGHIAIGSPQRQILQLSADLRADFIVIGSHGKKALERLLVGSVSEYVVKKAQCSVIVVRPKDYAPSDTPEIEPACPMCLDTQATSNGEKLWCTQHSARHAHGQLHYEVPQSFGVGSMLLRPQS